MSPARVDAEGIKAVRVLLVAGLVLGLAALGAGGRGGGVAAAAPGDELPPNELGLVPILMYHHIGRPEATWTRTPENFRADLERLYRMGFRPVLVSDYLRGWIDVPRGTHPVVITFDDGSEGQFRYLQGPDGEPWVDPESAWGIMLDFAREHPDFPPRATFFVNFPHPFRQPEWVERKLRELVAAGSELGNHTYWHVNLRRANPSEGERELAAAQEAARRLLPGYRLLSLALPFGAMPREEAIARSGGRGDGRYQHLGVLLVGAQPARSPFDPKLDRTRIPRIRADQTELDRWLGMFERKPELLFTSDGRPDVVTTPEGPVTDGVAAPAARLPGPVPGPGGAVPR